MPPLSGRVDAAAPSGVPSSAPLGIAATQPRGCRLPGAKEWGRGLTYPAMTEGPDNVNKDVRPPNRVTITEAATLLGVHPNTVRNRVRGGVYDAEKVSTEHGFTWMIDRDSLVNTPLPRASQDAPPQTVNLEGPQPLEVVQELLRPFVEDLGRVREELGAERVRREQAERERDRLAEELSALREAREAPQTDAEEPEGAEPLPATEGAQEGAQPRSERSWWRRFFGFE